MSKTEVSICVNFFIHWLFPLKVMNKKAFQMDAYRPRHNKDERWLSSHEADCEQNDWQNASENINFSLQSVKNTLKLHVLK